MHVRQTPPAFRLPVLVPGPVPVEGFQQLSSRLKQDVAALRAVVDGLNARTMTSEAIHVQLEERAKDNKGEVANAVKAIQEKQEKHAATLGLLFERIHVLESATLELRPSAVPIYIRKQLDNARFCVADGFMKLFPSKFTYKDVVNKFDSTADTLEWDQFKSRVGALYWLHVAPESGKKELYQIRSAFDLCTCRAELLGYTPPDPAKKSLIPAPDPLLFQRSYIAEFDANTWRPYGDSGDDFVTRQLRVFIPTFIWAFNELKKALHDDDIRIRSLREAIHDQQRLFEYLMRIPHPPSSIPEELVGIESRFALGTGRELRKSEFWRRFLSVEKGEVTAEASSGGRVEDMERGAEQVVINKTEEQKNTGALEPRQGSSMKPEATESDRVSTERKRQAGGPDAGIEGDEQRPIDMPKREPVPSEISPLSDSSQPSSPNVGAASAPQSSLRSRLECSDLLDNSIRNCEYFKGRAMVKLEAMTKRRKGDLDKYTSILKCLSILVDTNLIKFAVHGMAVVHKVADHVVHGKFEYDADIDVALKCVQELIDADEQLNEINIQEGSKELSKLLYESEDYFDKQGATVERAVDKYLNGESIRNVNVKVGDGTQQFTKTDLHVLMSWLEEAYPVL